ncbi:MAG: hypothetical protein A2169_07330, partial [Deltaproteobacteria bacterium RBG_13_47_9]
GRSGTTLLRLMLDAHPDIAIPPETHFVSRLNLQYGREGFFSVVTSEATWEDFHIDQAAFKNVLNELNPFSVTEGLRCFYRLYADKYGKKYVGDKTPIYSLSMTSIQIMLPEARFIHVIRDGRDVALSQRGLWFGPGDDINAAAEFWSSRIQNARQQAPLLKHYLEILFEQLILNPVVVLTNICDFLEIPFSEKMLTYHISAAQRLDELRDRYHSDGSVRVKREDLKSLFKLTKHSPDATRIFCWKNQMSDADQLSYEKIAGQLLTDLGYETRFTEYF